MRVFDPLETYVQLSDGPDATLHAVGPDFWQTIGTRDELRGGRLMSAYRFTEDGTSWERHPAGDELVVQLTGAMDLILDETNGERTVSLKGRAAVIVPRGVWHTARVFEPSEAIFITRGDGTEHRPLRPGKR
jgi:mannose-6-phosphate isomerase-like protein (cupin superfamily)